LHQMSRAGFARAHPKEASHVQDAARSKSRVRLKHERLDNPTDISRLVCNHNYLAQNSKTIVLR